MGNAEQAREKFIEALIDYVKESEELTKMYVEAKNELNKMFNARVNAIGITLDKNRLEH